MNATFALRPLAWLGTPNDGIRRPRMRAPLAYPDNEFGEARREVQYDVSGAHGISRVAACGDAVRVLGGDGEVLLDAHGVRVNPAPVGVAAETYSRAHEVLQKFRSELAAGRVARGR